MNEVVIAMLAIGLLAMCLWAAFCEMQVRRDRRRFAAIEAELTLASELLAQVEARLQAVERGDFKPAKRCRTMWD